MTAPTLHCTAVGCVQRPGHDKTCLPRPSRVYRCIHCAGKGVNPITDFTCDGCMGTGLGS